MSVQELTWIIIWWAAFCAIGIITFPITSLIFKDFSDKGYIFSKTIGLVIFSYIVFILSIFRIFKFSTGTIYFSILILLFINVFVLYKQKMSIKFFNEKIIIYTIQELLFFVAIFFWAFVRGFEPSIHGLEKFMDFGFVNSILRSEYFPPVDIWFPPFSINYYYYGHFIAALITKLTQVPSNISYNLMLATIFSFTLVSSFSIGINLFNNKKIVKNSVIVGIFAALFVTFAGNLHTLYSFFTSYNTDNPLPFWSLPFSLNTFSNSYWYPNATRFIPFTIHEFPIYSFVVSDLHGHVSDIPFVLLMVALMFSILLSKRLTFTLILFISLILSVMYMTNAWDGIIYLFLSVTVITIIILNKATIEFKDKIKDQKSKIKNCLLAGRLKLKNYDVLKYLGILILGYFVFTLPFNLNFKPFVSGIGVLCAPDFLTNIGKIGPFLFEVNHCQKSSLWQLMILYGFFYFFVFAFIFFILTKKDYKIQPQDYLVTLMIILSTILIIIPEFIYIKDIYPNHYRANTMFKLVYQAFILLSLCSAYVLVRITNTTKNVVFFLLAMIVTTLVVAYPYFAVPSYYGKFLKYQGLDGILYLKNTHLYDYEAILWMNKNIEGQPVILEAQGDSYTDYGRISANTGLPTVLGWTVHEWLWRGSYNVPAPRITEVQNIYEDRHIERAKKLLKKYNVKYVYVGDLEREKYKNIYEGKFEELGKVVYQNPGVKIYKLQI